MASVLFIGVSGQDPNIDLPPGVSAQELDAAIHKGTEAMKNAGYSVSLLMPPIMDGIAALEKDLETNRYDLVLVSLGIRIVPKHTPYFEGIVNIALKYNPGQRFAFNASLDSMLEAAQRALPL
ncbi:hypothetical protein SLS59_000304 [Nothophoma quercina]|uniref:Uncharacterized protein n=1 Tax=Nothophoma quercina TaxID=749835 RepID=A0ABR3S4H6_9PLEO